MKLFKSFARSRWTRTLGLTLSLLFTVAPFARAEVSSGGPLVFDVPDAAQPNAEPPRPRDPPITLNLLQRGQIDAFWFLTTAELQIANEETTQFLDVKIVGDYCVTISNPADVLFSANDDISLNIQAIRAPNAPPDIVATTLDARIAVIDREDSGGGVNPADPACRRPNQSPTASLKVQATVPDSDFAVGEDVLLDASGSSDPDGRIVNYRFEDDQGNVLKDKNNNPLDGPNPSPTARLPDGENVITLIVTDDSAQSQPVFTKTSFRSSRRSATSASQFTGEGTGATATTTATVDVGQRRQLMLNQIGAIQRNDTDGQPGEQIQVNASTNADGAVPVTFKFFLNPGGESNGTLLTSTGGTLSFRFPDNNSILRVIASAGDQTVTQDVSVSVTPRTTLAFTVNLTNVNQGDTDAAAGELVTLDVTNSTNLPGNLVTFRFFLNPGDGDGTLIFTGPVLKQRFDDGVNRLRLVATVGDQRAFVDFTVTVAPPPSVFARAGADQNLSDSDGRIGEVVRLDASASTTPPNGTTTFQWFLNPSGQNNGQALGSGVVINPRLPDGMSVVRLVATVGSQVSIDELTVTIGVRQAVTLANLPNLTPNQRRTAVALDDVCSRLLGLESGALTGTTTGGPARPAAALTADQSDLTEKCRGIIFNNSVDNQVEAVTDITPEDFAVARTQALLFANTQYASVLDRLIALRGGARGLSLAGLNIVVDGQSVPVAALQDMVGKIFGTGASADATEEPGGLLSDRWGMWVRGNYSTGGRDKSLVSPSFDASQVGITIGTDYRLSRNSVIGASLGYLDSSIDFNPISEGSLDTRSMALSLYGSLYAAKSFYLDGLVNYAQADYDARRNISYNQGSGLVPIGLDARGSTKGDTFSAGLSGGYDFLFKGITISPNAGFFYVDTNIDRFAEKGAAGLNLLYDDQKFQSLTANLGFRVGATWNLPWVVLVPGLRFDFVREFEDQTDVFQVRFANDPNGLSSPPIVIQTDNPDTSYYRISLNLSAQFKFGFAGYVEYQRIQSFSQIDFSDLAFGFRMQRSF